MNRYKEIYDFGFDKDFLFKDKQLGINTLINGVNAYDAFNADSISMSIIPPKVEKNIYKSLGKQDYKINTFKLGDGGLDIRYYIGGHTQQEAQINVNKLIREFVDKTAIIKTDETDFEYICVLESFTSEYTGVEFYYLVTLTLNAVKRLPLVTYDFAASYFSSNATVTCDFENTGMIQSGLDIILRFGGSTGFEIDYKNEKGKTQEVVFTSLSTSNYYYKIGGLDGVVYRAGNINFATPTNVFSKSDLVDFPVVKSGENSVTFVQNTAGNIKQAKIQFYPTFML